MNKAINIVICLLVGFASSLQAQSVQCGVGLEGHVLTDQQLIDQVGGQMVYNYQRTVTRIGARDQEVLIEYAFDEQDFYLNRKNREFLRGGITCRLPDGESLLSGVQLGVDVGWLSTGGHYSTVLRSDTLDFVYMKSWDGKTNLPPLINTRNEGWTSDIPFFAQDGFDLLVVDVSAEKDLIEYDDGAVGAYVGMRFADASYWSYMNASQDVYYHVTVNWYLNGEWWYGYTQEFQNDITLDTYGLNDSFSWGPTYGFTVTQDILGFTIDALVTQSKLIENNNYSGTFHDVDDITETIDYLREDGSVYATRNTDAYYDGWATYEGDKSRRITVNDMRLALYYNLGNLDVGGGVLVQQWKDMMLSPMLNDPWGLTGSSKAPTGVNWVTRTPDVNLTSWFAMMRWYPSVLEL